MSINIYHLAAVDDSWDRKNKARVNKKENA